MLPDDHAAQFWNVVALVALAVLRLFGLNSVLEPFINCYLKLTNAVRYSHITGHLVSWQRSYNLTTNVVNCSPEFLQNVQWVLTPNPSTLCRPPSAWLTSGWLGLSCNDKAGPDQPPPPPLLCHGSIRRKRTKEKTMNDVLDDKSQRRGVWYAALKEGGRNLDLTADKWLVGAPACSYYGLSARCFRLLRVQMGVRFAFKLQSSDSHLQLSACMYRIMMFSEKPTLLQTFLNRKL